MYLFPLLCFLTWKWKFTAPCRHKNQSKVLKCTRAHSKGNPAIQLYLGPSIIQYSANLHVPGVTYKLHACWTTYIYVLQDQLDVERHMYHTHLYYPGYLQTAVQLSESSCMCTGHTGFCRIFATHYNLDFQMWKLFQPTLVSVINFHIWKSRL